MNLLTLKSDQISGTKATVSGRQLEHLTTVHKVSVGDSVRVGELNGLIGTGIITQITDHSALLELQLDTPPPPPLPLTLVMALPRPKMLRRTLQSITSMGVKTLYLINSARVEKSFWQTPFLSESALEKELLLGLEQSRDTILPSVHLHKLFKPFVEDKLREIIADSYALVAHPTGAVPCPVNIKKPTTLIVGPEGGFIPYEIEKLAEVGAEAVTLGERILRVETAVPALISRLFPT
jgi:16S rRNA (uracil1498-N3)-methyltransferase